MQPCKACGAVLEADRDGFISLRKPAGLPNEMMPSLVARLYAELMLTAELVTAGKKDVV